MASFEDVRRLALALPETEESTMWGSAAWKVRKKLFVWERPLRKTELAALGDAAPEGPILGIKVEHDIAKRALLESEPDVCFTTPHFDGHAIVLVLLDKVGEEDLADFVTEAWLCAAPKRLVDAFLADGD